MTAIEATFIFALARVLDAPICPLMGFLTDNFGTARLGKRFGRRKMFILLGIPGVFSYSLMWGADMSYLWYLLTCLAFDIVYTMVLVPYETLVPELTDDLSRKPAFPAPASHWPSSQSSSPRFCPAFCRGFSARIMRCHVSMPA